MVRKNQVASQPSRGLTEQRRSTSLPDGSDALPLLPLRSTRSSGAAANAEEPAGSQRLTAQDSNANDQLQSSAARLDALLEEWEPPDDKVARLAHIKTHYHHELFSLSDTQTQDLAEFGQGLALYFYFLKWMAVLLAAMSLIVLPSCAWYGIARQTAATTTGLSDHQDESKQNAHDCMSIQLIKK